MAQLKTIVTNQYVVLETIACPKMELENYIVKCKKFRDAQAVIWRTEVKIKEAVSSRGKRYYAQDILLEAETLLSCVNYVAESLDCRKCHSISHDYIQEQEYLAREEIKPKNFALQN